MTTGKDNGTSEIPRTLEEFDAILGKLEKRPPQRKDQAKDVLEYLVTAVKDLPIAPESKKKWTKSIHESRKGNVIAAAKERIAYFKEQVQALIAIAAEDKEHAFAARVMSDEAAAKHVGGLPEETARIADAGKEAVAEVEAAKQEYAKSVGDAMDAAATAEQAELAHDWRAAISEREAQLVRKALEIGGGRAMIYVPRGIVRGEASGAVNIAIGKEASGVEAARSVSFARKVFAGFSEKLAPQYAMSEASVGEEVMRRHKRQEVAAFLPAAEGGAAEPAVWFFYRAISGRDPATTWKDTEAGGRPMAGVDFSLLLPEGFAKELAAAVEANPALVRLFAEQAMQESPDVAQPDRWNQPSEDGKRPYLRPPYERWDAAPGGGKIYIQPLNGPRGWHDEFDRPVRFGTQATVSDEEKVQEAAASSESAAAVAEALKQMLAEAEAEEKEKGNGGGQKLITGEIFGKDPDEKLDLEKALIALEGKDNYEILGIARNATHEEIRKAYAKLVIACHPDTHPGDAVAESLFRRYTEAYDILRDDVKRAKYDRDPQPAWQGVFTQGPGEAAPAEQDPVRAAAFARLEDIRARMRKHFDTLEGGKGKSRMRDAVGHINAAVSSFKELAEEFAPGDAGLVTSMVEVGKLAGQDPKAAWDMAETLIEQLRQAIAAPSEKEKREAAEAQLTDALNELTGIYRNLYTKPEYFLAVPQEKFPEVPARIRQIMDLLPVVLGRRQFEGLTFVAAGDGAIAVDLSLRTVRVNIFEDEAYAVADKVITSIEEAKLAPFKERLRDLAAEYPKASFRIKDENLAAMLPRAERLLQLITSGVDNEWIVKQLGLLITDEGGADSVTLQTQPGGLLATVAQFNLGHPDSLQQRVKSALETSSMKQLIERKKAEEEKIKGQQREQARQENKRNAEREKNDPAAFELHLEGFRVRYPGFDIAPLLADRTLPEAAEILRSVEDTLLEDGPDLALAGITMVSFIDGEEPFIRGKNELCVPLQGGAKGLRSAIGAALDRIDAIVGARDVLETLPRGFAYESDESLPPELHFKKKSGKGENKEEYVDTTPVEGLAYAAKAVVEKASAELGADALARAGMTLVLTNASEDESFYSSSSLNAQATRMVLNINMSEGFKLKSKDQKGADVAIYMARKQVAEHAVEMIRHEMLAKAVRDIRKDADNVLAAPKRFFELSPEAQNRAPDMLRNVTAALRDAFPPELFKKFSFALRPNGPALAFDSVKWRFTVNVLDGQDAQELARKAVEAAKGIEEDLEELRLDYPGLAFDLKVLSTLNRPARQAALPELRAKLAAVEAIMPNLKDVEGLIFEDGAELRLKGKEMRVGFDLPADRIVPRIGTIIAARYDMQQSEKAQAKIEAKYPGKRVDMDFAREITTKEIIDKEQPETILRSWSAAMIVKYLAEKMDPADFAALKLTITDSGEPLRKEQDGYVLNIAHFRTRAAAAEEVMRTIKREKEAKAKEGGEGTLEEQKLRKALSRIKNAGHMLEKIPELVGKKRPLLAYQFRRAALDLDREIANIPSEKMEAERPRLREKARQTINALMPATKDSTSGMDFRGQYGQLPTKRDKEGKEEKNDAYDANNDIGSVLVDALFDMRLHYRQVHPGERDPDAWSKNGDWQAPWLVLPTEPPVSGEGPAQGGIFSRMFRGGRAAAGSGKEVGKMRINLVGKEAKGTRPAGAPRRPRPAERPQSAAPESGVWDGRWESLPEAKELDRARTEYARAQVARRKWEYTLSADEYARIDDLRSEYDAAPTTDEKENILKKFPKKGREMFEAEENAMALYARAQADLRYAATSRQRSALEARGLSMDEVDEQIRLYREQLWDVFSVFGEEGQRLDEEKDRISREGTP